MVEKRFPPGKILGTTGENSWINLSPLSNQITMYPRSISMEDIDKFVFEWFNKREIFINDELVPAFFLSPEKWAEFKTRWKYMNVDRIVDYPFITVRRIGFNLAQQPIKGRIPGKKFTIYKLPVKTNAGPTILHYKVPQPIKIDMNYEIRILTHYITDSNKINEILLRHFASLEAYLDIDKHYMPMIIDSISDETEHDNLEEERIMHTLYSIQVRGYIIDENEFEEKLGINNILVTIDEEIK